MLDMNASSYAVHGTLALNDGIGSDRPHIENRIGNEKIEKERPPRGPRNREKSLSAAPVGAGKIVEHGQIWTQSIAAHGNQREKRRVAPPRAEARGRGPRASRGWPEEKRLTKFK